MKKFLRFVVGLTLIAIATILVVGAIQPTEVVITRSIVIKAPKETVFHQMSHFREWPNWSPWVKMDSSLKMTYEGTDGEVGSSYHWLGDEKKTGEGAITATVINGSEMETNITFIKPWDKEAKSKLTAKDTAGMTKATWSMSMHFTYPFNAMNMFVSMDKFIGADLENGLNNMKQFLEGGGKATPSAPVIVIQVVDFPAHTYEGMRKTVALKEFMNFFRDSYGTIEPVLGGKISGPAAGIFFTWDTVNHTSDMAAVYPVSDTTDPVKNTVITNIPALKAYMTTMKGGYSGAKACHDAIMARVMADNKVPTYIIEEYNPGHYNEADSTKWVTNIYYLVR